MVGNDMGKFMQYQTAQAIPKMAEGVGAGGDAGGLAGAGLGMGAGVAMGQILAQNMQSALQGTAPAAGAAAAAAPVGVKPEDVMATLEKLGELKSKGILTDDEFNAKKAELLKKLV
ncbi:MAG TPA: SHOCT domain-containing protein, partial [Ottowia sp.]|nr:SHOCT domain-containing protein [Ottowia sp.]